MEVEEMSYDELIERVNELGPEVEEYENLRAVLWLLDEGFVTMDDDGRLWPVS